MQALKKEATFCAASKKISPPISPLSGCSIKQQGKKTEAKKLEQEMDKILQQLKTFKDSNSQKGGDLALHDNAVAQALAKDILEVLPEKYIRMDLIEAFALGTLNKDAYGASTGNIKGSGTALQQTEYKQVKMQIENFLNTYIKNIEDVISSLGNEVYKNDINSYLNRIKNATDGFLASVGKMEARKGTYSLGCLHAFNANEIVWLLC